MPKYFILICTTLLLFSLRCQEPERKKNIVIIYRFDHPAIAADFVNAAARTADSLGIRAVFVDGASSLTATTLDTIFSHIDGIAASADLRNKRLAAAVAKKAKRTPVIRFDEQIDSLRNFYSAGRRAGRFIVEKFGASGRFGILTSSLDNANTNESIRGFREELITHRNKWRQVNILTFSDDPERALQQFRRLNRFGARTVWFMADGNRSFFNTLRDHKKNNYFIALDLHANKNSITLLQEGVLDAIATEDVKELGKSCVIELAKSFATQEKVGGCKFKGAILTRTTDSIRFQ